MKKLRLLFPPILKTPICKKRARSDRHRGKKNDVLNLAIQLFDLSGDFIKVEIECINNRVLVHETKKHNHESLNQFVSTLVTKTKKGVEVA